MLRFTMKMRSSPCWAGDGSFFGQSGKIFRRQQRFPSRRRPYLRRNVWPKTLHPGNQSKIIWNGLQMIKPKTIISFSHFGGCYTELIGIGAAVTRRPLPHHRAYGSVHGGSRWLRRHFLRAMGGNSRTRGAEYGRARLCLQI